MFTDRSSWFRHNPPRHTYGLAVADLTGEGTFSLITAGYRGPNRVLRPTDDGLVDVAGATLADRGRQAIGVAAADVDGDGREEMYVLNTDSFAGHKRFADRLFDARQGGWVNLFDDPANASVRNLTAGRSVACIDREGSGRYGFFVANYGGPMRLYETDGAKGALDEVAAEVGVDYTTGGRGVVSLPIVSPWMDLFCVNERGPNFLFRNQGDGTFDEVACRHGVSDRYEHGRGVDALDTGTGDGFGLVYGNWKGRHRLLVQRNDGTFTDAAPEEMARPSGVRSVIAADFDNDGQEEIFFNNIDEANRLFARRDGRWTAIDPGEAREPAGRGTGAAVADLDGDGSLELIVAHGEVSPQPLTLYGGPSTGNHYLRVRPTTTYGAPARGAVVACTAGNRTRSRSIDAGSAYLCQMEPVAHFGLGQTDTVDAVRIRWPDGRTRILEGLDADQDIRVPHPDADATDSP